MRRVWGCIRGRRIRRCKVANGRRELERRAERSRGGYVVAKAGWSGIVAASSAQSNRVGASTGLRAWAVLEGMSVHGLVSVNVHFEPFSGSRCVFSCVSAFVLVSSRSFVSASLGASFVFMYFASSGLSCTFARVSTLFGLGVLT